MGTEEGENETETASEGSCLAKTVMMTNWSFWYHSWRTLGDGVVEVVMLWNKME